MMSDPCGTVRPVETLGWTAVGLLGAAVLGSFGAFFYLGTRIDALGSQVTARIDSLFEQIGPMQRTMGSLDARMTRLQETVEALDSRMGAVEEAVGSLGTRLVAVEQRLGAVDRRLDALASKLDEHVRRHAS
jgi:chromosome segregation ATPase